MINTTLVYLEHDGKYLMLHRNKKENDINEGKWIGAGGKFEPGETPKECAVREVLEETGYECRSLTYRAEIAFISDCFDSEMMHLFTCSDFEKKQDPISCEGTFRWIDKNRIFDLNLWEGDRIFMKYLMEEKPFFHMRLEYEGYDLVKAYLEDEVVFSHE